MFPNAQMKAIVGFGESKHDKMDELKGGIFHY